MANKEFLKSMRLKREELRKQIMEEAKEVFKSEAKTLFEQYPQLESFSWRQYTPYWNDGEPCEFHAQTDYPDVNGEDEYSIQAELKPAYKAITSFLNEFDEEEYEEMFGDHVKVTVTKDAVSVDEYDHD